jgi:hypothetical protein
MRRVLSFANESRQQFGSVATIDGDTPEIEPLPLALPLAPLLLPIPDVPEAEPVEPDAAPPNAADFNCTCPLAVLQCVAGEMF